MGRRPAPTKANLFKAQHELKFASEGCDLLHQKRDVLIMELMSVSADFKDEEQSLRKSLMDAFEDFIPAYAASGVELMDRVFGTSVPEPLLNINERGIMGMRVPEVEMESGGEPVFPGLLDASPAMDAAVSGMNAVMETLLDYIETVATIWRLATEIEKTQRRINAIENVFIPESRTTVNWIRSVMEENEREELFRRKLLKSKSEQ